MIEGKDLIAVNQQLDQPAVNPFRGGSAEPLQKEIASVLQEPIAPDDLDILPTGEVYLSQIKYRRILNKAVGPGGWCLEPLSKVEHVENTIVVHYALYIFGRFMSEAIGEAEYQPQNARMSWATAIEAAKSNALMRVCKDLGIASECWDRRFTQKFQEEYCVQVWRGSKDRPEWRRKDAPQFYDEKGPVLKPEGGITPKAAPTPSQVAQPAPPAPQWDENDEPSTETHVEQPPSASTEQVDFTRLSEFMNELPPNPAEDQVKSSLLKLLSCWPEPLRDHALQAASSFPVGDGNVRQILKVSDIEWVNKTGKPRISVAWARRTYNRLREAAEEALGGNGGA